MQDLRQKVESFWKQKNYFLLLLTSSLFLLGMVIWLQKIKCNKDVSNIWYNFLAKYSLKTISHNNLCREANLLLVKVFYGKTWGSGFLIANERDQYTLITNGHVLKDNKEIYEIQTYDGKKYKASLIVRFDHGPMTGNDLAILQFNSSEKYNVARLGEWYKGQRVMAAGYPLEPVPKQINNNCTQMGEVFRELPKSMEKGYQLGYFLSILNGMSGGPVMNNQGQVVAISGITIPIFFKKNIYLYRDGSSISDTSIDDFSKASWAIPVQTMIDLLPSKIHVKY